MIRPDHHDIDVTMARVAHSDYLWRGVRMVAPNPHGPIIYQQVGGNGVATFKGRKATFDAIQLLTIAYADGRAPMSSA